MKRGRIKMLRLVMVCTMVLMVLMVGLASSTDAQPPIKMGVNSAWDYPGGQGVKRGAEMAIMDINAAGGLLGRKVEGIFYDNKADPGEAKNATERLLYRDKVDVICGFWRSDLAIVCQPLVMEAKKILLIGGASTPVITYDRIKSDYNTYKYTFTTTVNTHYLISLFEQGIILSTKLGLNKLAVIVEKAAWADSINDYFLKKYASRVVYSTRFSPTATDFSVEFSQAKAAGTEIMEILTTGRGGTPSVKQWYDMRIPAMYTGHNVDAQDPNFWKITEGKCQGIVAAKAPGQTGYPITQKSIPFYTQYKKLYGEDPIAYTNGSSYDAVMAWARGVKIAGTVESDAVVKALERRDFNHEGVLGLIEYFDEIHNPVGGAWKKGESWGNVTIQWLNGKQEILWPEAYKTTDLIIPEWVKRLMK